MKYVVYNTRKKLYWDRQGYVANEKSPGLASGYDSIEDARRDIKRRGSKLDMYEVHDITGKLVWSERIEYLHQPKPRRIRI